MKTRVDLRLEKHGCQLTLNDSQNGGVSCMAKMPECPFIVAEVIMSHCSFLAVPEGKVSISETLLIFFILYSSSLETPSMLTSSVSKTVGC